MVERGDGGAWDRRNVCDAGDRGRSCLDAFLMCAYLTQRSVLVVDLVVDRSNLHIGSSGTRSSGIVHIDKWACVGVMLIRTGGPLGSLFG